MEWSLGAELWSGVLECSGLEFWSDLEYGIRSGLAYGMRSSVVVWDFIMRL